jgi:CBS domain-containing protein
MTGVGAVWRFPESTVCRGDIMLIAAVLRAKGPFVATIRSDSTIATLVEMLARYEIGALVVSDDGSHVQGIVSERDVVRHLDEHRSKELDGPVSSIMTSPARTCTPSDTVEDVMRTMTEMRARHLPVIVDGVLGGIVSIGDVVKTLIDELRIERNELIEYIGR